MLPRVQAYDAPYEAMLANILSPSVRLSKSCSEVMSRRERERVPCALCQRHPASCHKCLTVTQSTPGTPGPCRELLIAWLFQFASQDWRLAFFCPWLVSRKGRPCDMTLKSESLARHSSNLLAPGSVWQGVVKAAVGQMTRHA